MARKPRSGPKATGRGSKPLSPAYAARLAQGKAKGLTPQQARGHEPREHIERRRREKEKYGGVTLPQKRKIEAFVDFQAKRRGRPDADQRAEDKRELVSWVKQKEERGEPGYREFARMRDYVHRRVKHPPKRKRTRTKTTYTTAEGGQVTATIHGTVSPSPGAAEFWDMYDDIEPPNDDETWLFYR
jgi:hypothetical protein